MDKQVTALAITLCMATCVQCPGPPAWWKKSNHGRCSLTSTQAHSMLLPPHTHTKKKKNVIFKLLYVCRYFVCMYYVYHVQVWYSWRPEEGVGLELELHLAIM